MRIFLPLLLMSWGMAEELRIVTADPLLRPGMLFRCTVLYSGPDVGPCVVSAALIQGDRVLSHLDVPLERSSQLGGTGARLALPLPLIAGAKEAAPRLAVTISGAGASGSAERAVGTVETARLALENHYAWLKKHDETAPLPWLWIEQGAAFAAAPTTLGNLAGLDAANAALEAWQKKSLLVQTGTAVLAVRDPVDGSIQPFRLHLPSHPEGAPIALLLNHCARIPKKERWPTASNDLISAITSAGLAVVEAYPAGDVHWLDIAPRRALLALDAAVARRDLKLDGNRPVLIGVGNAATGARQLAEDDPGRWGAVLLASPHWSDGSYHPENLTTLPLAIIGEPIPAVQHWLERLTGAGGLIHNASDIHDATSWNWLLSARTTMLPVTTPRTCIRSLPGPAGPVVIEELAHWGAEAAINWQGDPMRITTSGVAQLRLLNPTRGVLVDGKPYRAPRDAGKKPRKAWGQACGPLDAYAARPFVIVVGGAESVAAAAANADLAQRFLSAWVDHAQGAPPMIADQDFRPRDWPGRNLVLIGNARSNSALRDLVKDGMQLPLTWDARSLHGCGIDALRAEARPVALCWPHPANDGRLLVVLDGAPAWDDKGLPLAGLPDLFIGPSTGGTTPLLSKTFACDWR